VRARARFSLSLIIDITDEATENHSLSVFCILYIYKFERTKRYTAVRILKPVLIVAFYLFLFLVIAKILYVGIAEMHLSQNLQKETPALILTSEAYLDENFTDFKQRLVHRAQVQPFNLIALGIFVLAIIHTLLANKFTQFARYLQKRRGRLQRKEQEWNSITLFWIEFFQFMGEIEVIFGLWVIPLLIAMTFAFDWNTATQYVSSLNYVEPLFVVVIMTIASTKPIVTLAETCLHFVAKLGGETTTAWWLTLLIAGPLLGSLITEPAAMTVTALLLGKQIYRFHPKDKLAYLTLGLLFTNISVGGLLTNFAAPPILMVAQKWQWDSAYIFIHFGLNAIISVTLTTLACFCFLRKDLQVLEEAKQVRLAKHPDDGRGVKIPFWIILVNITFMTWIIIHNHYPAIFIGSFLLFLGFYKATEIHQSDLELKTPILVGFFLGALVVHANLQAWWISPLLEKAQAFTILLFSLALSPFVDNSIITYLASLTPNFDDAMKYAVVVGTIAGGGITIIANAPNPAGQAILRDYFPKGIAPTKLCLAALIPTFIVLLVYYFVRW